MEKVLSFEKRFKKEELNDEALLHAKMMGLAGLVKSYIEEFPDSFKYPIDKEKVTQIVGNKIKWVIYDTNKECTFEDIRQKRYWELLFEEGSCSVYGCLVINK
ncbi:MAG: hypothetical protein LBJ04_22710 [Sphingobacterium sp.]|jgi:hypothetical protein|nr:hypothetical protein [Sphingobacterium sp.]